MVLTKTDYVTIHKAIHNKKASDVSIQGTKYSVNLHNNGCRNVKISGIGTFIAQNADKDTEYAKRAKDGESITWLIRDASWGLIVNNEVITK